MSRTNIDFLFQAPAPVGERSCFNMPRIDDPRPAFGDLLNQTSATTLDTLSTTGGSDDQPATSESASSDYESPSSESSPHESVAAHEGVADDRADSSGGEPRNADVAETSAATHSGNTPVAAANEEADGEHDSDEEDAQSDGAITAVAEAVHSNQGIIAATAEASRSTERNDAIVKVDSSAGATQDGSANDGAEAKHVTTALPKSDAKRDDVTAAAHDALKAPSAPGEPVEETLPPKTGTQLRPAEPKPTTEAKRPNKENALRNEQVEAQRQNLDATSLDVAEAAETNAPSAEPTSGEPVAAEFDDRSDDARDSSTSSSTRQRSDAASLVNKISVAAVANGAASQPINNAPQRDEADNTVRESKAAIAKTDVAGASATHHANAALTKRGSRVSGTDEMPRVDPARFVGRVAKAFHTAQERGGTLQIRLSPPELGAMRLELAVADGVMTASLETETASARRVLLEHLPALRERLAEQNIRVERFDVDVRREGTGSQHDPRAAQDGQQPQQGHAEQRRRQAAPPPVAESARQIKSINAARTNNHGINLVA